MKALILILCLVVVGALLALYLVPKPRDQIDLCIQACREALEAGVDLGVGPCLLDPMPAYPEWVCDVAHSPRIPEIDNLPENQCSAWREGRARHFVEVTPDCELITSY
jgi:hypothetical protein